MKKQVVNAVLLVAMVSLTGCASMRARHHLKQECATTAAVYGDLTERYATQQYYLANGAKCPATRSAS